ncbi:hypothetical protein RRF57_009718 [Xylaria bambusicola]|uniref:Uncharacterized protein n=1 Tax=Xylaria bambusicola TaxID=326684 RepID=A0AAN7UZT7_9PEZI
MGPTQRNGLVVTICKRSSSPSKLAMLSRDNGGLRRSNDLGPNKSALRTFHGIWTVQVKGIVAICFPLFGYHHHRQRWREYLAVGNMRAQELKEERGLLLERLRQEKREWEGHVSAAFTGFSEFQSSVKEH